MSWLRRWVWVSSVNVLNNCWIVFSLKSCFLGGFFFVLLNVIVLIIFVREVF